MNKEQVNELLKRRIGYTKDEEIEELRDIYKRIINSSDEVDFYWSVYNWFFDGNAPYYDNYLKKNWDEK